MRARGNEGLGGGDGEKRERVLAKWALETESVGTAGLAGGALASLASLA